MRTTLYQYGLYKDQGNLPHTNVRAPIDEDRHISPPRTINYIAYVLKKKRYMFNVQ